MEAREECTAALYDWNCSSLPGTVDTKKVVYNVVDVQKKIYIDT